MIRNDMNPALPLGTRLAFNELVNEGLQVNAKYLKCEMML